MINNDSEIRNLSDTEKEKLLINDFPYPDYQKWRNEVEKQLKGNSFEKKMATETYEGIDLKPIYTKDDISKLKFLEVFPGFTPYLRGADVLGYMENSWDIAQEISDPTPEKLNEALRFDLNTGQTAINIVLDKATRHGKDPDNADVDDVGQGGTSISSLKDFEKALNGIDLKKTPVYIHAGTSALPAAVAFIAYALNNSKDILKINGSIETDPLGESAAYGNLPVSFEKACDEMFILTDWSQDNAPNIQTIGVNSQPYHNGGASAVEELAFAIATGVEYIREMQFRNLNINDIASRIRFTFSLGSNFFMEIAKLRAARLTWAKVVDACGGNKRSQKMTIHARTSDRNITVYDPYVNLLRAMTEAFSGGIGGCNSIHAGFFDQAYRQPDKFSRRISRNIQLILNEESHLDKVIDPAGGSWYIETLTDSIARKSWQLFQEIEKMGGMFKALQEGFPQETIARTASSRSERLAKCKDILVGTNKYPDPDEKPLSDKDRNNENIYEDRVKQIQRIRASSKSTVNNLLNKIAQTDKSSPAKLMEIAIEAAMAGATIGEIAGNLRKDKTSIANVKPVKICRDSEIFESVRRAVEAYSKKTGSSPKVFLANLGATQQQKSRSDFAIGFFQVGGFEVINSDGFNEIDKAAKAADESGAQVVVICSDDESYPALAPLFIMAITKAMHDAIIVFAGYPKDHPESLKQAGVDEFIYDGVDVPETLTRIAKRLGIIS